MLVFTDKYKCTSRGIDVTSLVYLKTNAMIDLNLLAPTVRWVWSKPYVLTNICIHELKIVPNMKSLNKSTERFLQEHFPDVSNLLSYSVTKVFVVNMDENKNSWVFFLSKNPLTLLFHVQYNVNIIKTMIVILISPSMTRILVFPNLKKKTRVILLHMDY